MRTGRRTAHGDRGVVRVGAGLLVTSFGVTHSPTAREPAGDKTAGIALMKQAVQVAKTFSEAAATHRTVAFAAHAGATKANASTLDANAAPLPALLAAVSGMVDQDSLDGARSNAAAMNTTPADGKLPYTNAPIIAVAAKGVLAVSAADSVQIAAGETVTLMSGHDTQLLTSPAELKTNALLAFMFGTNFDQLQLASELLSKNRDTKEFSFLVC